MLALLGLSVGGELSVSAEQHIFGGVIPRSCTERQCGRGRTGQKHASNRNYGDDRCLSLCVCVCVALVGLARTFIAKEVGGN